LEHLAGSAEAEPKLDALLQPVDSALAGFASLHLNPYQSEEITHGRALPLREFDTEVINKLAAEPLFRIYASIDPGEDYLLGMAKIAADKLKSVRLFPGLGP